MTETILCLLSWSRTGWTGPYERRPGDQLTGVYVAEEGWGGEDWVFATDDEQLVGGKLYTYAHGDPSTERVEASKGMFNVVFFTRRPAGDCVLVGAYLNAHYLDPKISKAAHAAAWKRMSSVADARRRQLRRAFKGSPRRSEVLATFDRDRPLRWVVRREDVRIFAERPGFVPSSLYPKNAYFFDKLDAALQAKIVALLDSTDADHASDEIEAAGFAPAEGTKTQIKDGRKLRVSHLVRERKSALGLQCRANNLSAGDPLYHTCEACDRTWLPEQGEWAIKGFDVHHQVPLADAGVDGRVYSLDELCVLCVQCHRLAHRSGMFTVEKLRDFHEKMRAAT